MLGFKKKLSALFLIALTTTLLGQSVIKADAPTAPEADAATVKEETEPAAKSDLPLRTDEDMLAQAEIYADNDNFTLYVVDKYKYTAGETEKVKEDTLFGVKNKKNGFIWWSSPINAAHDSAAKGAQIDDLSSQLTFLSGNPAAHSSSTARSAYRAKKKGTEWYYSYVTKIEKINNGFRMTFDFEKKSTVVAMEVVLEQDSLLVTIPQSSIQESATVGEAGSVMLSIAVLNSFGAAPEGERGYILVPDGSGAIINFDNRKTNTAVYAGQVYGRDFAVSQELAPPVNEQVYLPVYGIVRKNGEKGDNALVAIAEKGAENATIRANVSRQSATSYNSAWFDFRTRTDDSYFIGTRTTKLTVYESGGIKTGDIAVRYYMLGGDDLSYADVAETYRNYLFGGASKAKAGSSPYYLTLGGGTVKTHSIAGFPVDLQTAGTTYAEAKLIAESLKNGGVSELVMTYNDFNTAGIKREISSAVGYSAKLGGKNGYKKLSDFAAQNGFSLYPSVNFMSYFKSGGGYSFLLHSSKQTTKSYAAQTQYEFAFGTADKLLDTWTVLSPKYFPQIFDGLVNSFKKEGISKISLNTATYMLYSDFSRKNPYGGNYFNRRDAVQILTEGYKKLNDNGISLLAESANAYALPYVDFITDVPLYSSNYDLFDRDVPFYQMVIHGVIPYTTKPLNKSADADRLRLMALSTGTPLHYEFIYKNPSDFANSDYNKKFYANYNGWLAQSLKEYKLFHDIISDVSDKKIIGHKMISFYETETTFEGGKTIYINTDTGEIKVNGNAVNFGDYGLEKGSGYGEN